LLKNDQKQFRWETLWFATIIPYVFVKKINKYILIYYDTAHETRTLCIYT